MTEIIRKDDMMDSIEETFEGKPEWGYAAAMKALAKVPVITRKRQTVTDIIEQVKSEMCDNYCKIPGICSEAGLDESVMLKDFCEHCPLERL